jgi:HK97 family phage portal protein
VTIVPGKNGMVAGYVYKVDNVERYFPVNQITGKSKILHLKQFNPLDDWRGLSSIEPAAFSIDQHNQAAQWNQSLLQNGARPSGALVVNSEKGNLSNEQFTRLKEEIEDKFSGSNNAGRPMLLEGGLEWREMSMSPKDMDFIEAKNSSARDIALAFGVPPQLLGIPGDNTYSNMQEARLALWEETILPLLDRTADALNHWLTPMYGDGIKLAYDVEEISGLSMRREKIWQRIESASFLTINEKRKMIGLPEIEGGDSYGKEIPNNTARD